MLVLKPDRYGCLSATVCSAARSPASLCDAATPGRRRRLAYGCCWVALIHRLSSGLLSEFG